MTRSHDSFTIRRRPDTQKDRASKISRSTVMQLVAGSDIILEWEEHDIESLINALNAPNRTDSVALGNHCYLDTHRRAEHVQLLLWRDGHATPTDVFELDAFSLARALSEAYAPPT